MKYRRFRKSIATTNTDRRSAKAGTTVGCETLAITRRRSTTSAKGMPRSQPLTPTETECSRTFFHIRNLQCTNDGPSPVNKLETRPASMKLRRQFNCSSLMEGVKSQRAVDAKLEIKKRECLNAQVEDAPVAIVILRSNNQPSASDRNTNESRTGALRNEDTIQKLRNYSRCSEVRKAKLTLSSSSVTLLCCCEKRLVKQSLLSNSRNA